MAASWLLYGCSMADLWKTYRGCPSELGKGEPLGRCCLDRRRLGPELVQSHAHAAVLLGHNTDLLVELRQMLHAHGGRATEPKNIVVCSWLLSTGDSCHAGKSTSVERMG